MKRRRRTFHPPRRRVPPVKTARSRSAAVPLRMGALRVTVCGVVFVALIALKLALPGALVGLRGTLGSWLARDADFASAFSAVGHAVSGEDGVLDSLGDAYVAVFGSEAAQEVAGRAEIEAVPDAEPEPASEPEPVEIRAYPEHAAAEQRILGFDYTPPLTGAVTSGFGWREHPTTGRESFHYGVDVAADEGTEIACFADGTVGVVAESVELGRYLTVHHTNGFVTLYAHCSSISAQSGDLVRRGETIARVGSTGNATGPHLHFELHEGEDYLDPAYYLSQSGA
ncbi:MAG: M23 family metallopeptidase [Ruminococcaceae bacterium]|nr:M23 family metallopeptidase [Oscillospiraceae bacterium]